MMHKNFLLPAVVALVLAAGGSCAWAKSLETREKPAIVEEQLPISGTPQQAGNSSSTSGVSSGDGETSRRGIRKHKRHKQQEQRSYFHAGSDALFTAPTVIPDNAAVSAAADAVTVNPVERKTLPSPTSVSVSASPSALPEPAAVPAQTPVVPTSPVAASIPGAPPAVRDAVVQTLTALNPTAVIPDPANLLQPVRIPQTAVTHAQPGTTFLSLCYHDVQDADPDQTYVGVTTAKLIEQFAWFRDNDFVPVSVDDILMARAGGKPLPEKAVLLTFDDGYVSFYTRVYPLLKSYNYPAVLAVVDSWMDGGGGSAGDGTVDYAGVRMPASAFLNWDQIREMVKSGLVELASHTHASHKGIIANPQGSLEPAVVTHGYNKATQRYETDAEYGQRLKTDFTAAARKIAHETGRAPRIMVWPYGQYNQFAIDAAREAGMAITMTLDDGFGTVQDLTAIPRYLINADPDLQGFVVEMRDLKRIPPIRAATVDLDLLYSADNEQMLKNFDALIARVYAMRIGTVFIKGYASYDDTGVTRELYFPNRHLPVRADLMNRVAWQLATRTSAKVYGVMPVLSYDLGARGTPVLMWDEAQKRAALAPSSPRRVSPFDPRARQIVHEIYEDLGRAVPLDGVVFASDAALSEFEDASAPALAAYAAAGLPASVADIRADKDMMQRWTRLKTETLISFTRDLVNATRTFRAPLVTVRQTHSAPVFDASNETKYAQDFELFQKNYDYTGIVAAPLLENVSLDDTSRWLGRLVDAVNDYPSALPRSIFILQTVDSRLPKNASGRAIPEPAIAAQMRQLTRMGAMNFTFTPDDFVRDQPKESALHGDFSLQTYPYRP